MQHQGFLALENKASFKFRYASMAASRDIDSAFVDDGLELRCGRVPVQDAIVDARPGARKGCGESGGDIGTY